MIYLSVLTDDLKLQQFLAAFEWFVQTVKVL